MPLPRILSEPSRCADGFVALVSVLVIAAIAAAVTSAVGWSGAGALRDGIRARQSAQARAYADACAEDALEHLRESVYFTGNDGMTFANGSCRVGVVSGTGNTNRAFTATGTAGSVTRRVTITLTTIHPVPVVASWQEVP